MRTFGLIGYPLSHSFSKKYFTEKFEKEGLSGNHYELFPLENVDSLPSLIESNEGLEGFNVTIPHKVAVIPYLDEMEAAASFIGAVNCISIRYRQGKPFLKGYNTDAYGFEASLIPLLSATHQKALIFGDGGAAKAVKYVLGKLGISFLSVVRKESGQHLQYNQISSDLLQEYTLLINTTPLGMSPNVDTCPDIPYDALTSKHLAYDLVYNPEETMFLKLAKTAGASVKNGMEMLHLQADRSWFIWNNND